MANQVNLTFAGDARSLEQAAARASSATRDVGEASQAAGADMSDAAAESQGLTGKLGSLGAATEGAAGAIDMVGGALQGLADFQSFAADKAQRLARATNDVAQAQADYNQALLDGKQAVVDSTQAGIDLEQAQLDVALATKALADAERENGKGSAEARQAAIDLKQANADVAQAHADVEQAALDATQATIDATGAQLDLTDARKEANPSDLQQWADQLAVVTPLVMALVGVIALVTAAQWLWNAAQLASPTTWIVLGIAAIVAGIVLLWTQWDTISKAWTAGWNWIKESAASAWNWIKQIPGWVASAFGSIATAISAPFRRAFNGISDAWNATIGRLSWSVPGWVPGVGGNTISAPRLPRFHTGGTMPGLPGREGLAILQGGERVYNPSDRGASRTVYVNLGPALMELIQQEVGARGGDVQLVLGGARG
jgi:hypothetical protein